MARLRVKDGELAGHVVEVLGEVSIGREGADLTLPDPQVSRRHAVVRRTAGGLALEDLRSTNGTWVNGRRVTEPTQLAAGDELRIGATTLGIELAGPVMAIAAPQAVPAGPLPQPQPAAHGYSAPPAYAPAGFGASAGRPRAATRGTTAIIVTFVVIGVDALALLLYFALR